MSEIAQYQAPGQVVALDPTQSETVMSLAQWSQELDAAYHLAKSVCQTPFAPQHFRGKAEDAAVAMLFGRSLKMDPLIALKSIYLVHGTPALYAQAMYSIALREGHQIERVHATEQSVKFRCRRKGSRDWQDVEWSIDRARKAGYTSNKKYMENPVGMLTEKCKAEAAKLVAGDALSGMASVEEVELGDYDDAEIASSEEIPTITPPKKTTVRRKAVSRAKAPEPAVPDVSDTPDPEPVEETAEDTEPAGEEPGDAAVKSSKSTKSQWDLAAKLMRDMGISSPGEMGAEMRAWAKEEGITRELGSMKDLTSDEATGFVNYLETTAANTTTGELPAEDGQQSWQTTEVPE